MWKIVKMPIADWLPYPPSLYINIGFGLNVAYLDRQHHYSSVFLRDLDSNSPDRMYGFLIVHRAHMTHCSLTSHSRLKKLNEIIMGKSEIFIVDFSPPPLYHISYSIHMVTPTLSTWTCSIITALCFWEIIIWTSLITCSCSCLITRPTRYTAARPVAPDWKN